MYRESRVGDCLVDALQVLLDEGKISKELAFNVLKQVNLVSTA